MMYDWFQRLMASRIGRSRSPIWSIVWGLVLMVSIWAIAPTSSSAQPTPPVVPIPEPTDAPLRSSLNSADISSEKVSQFVDAYIQVTQLIQRRQGELQAVETETESLQLQREIEAAAIRIIEESGLTWQEYVQLIGLANIDPDFGDRIAAQLQD